MTTRASIVVVPGDASSTSYDQEAAALLTQRTLDFLAGL
jgi:hypothetical protein